MSDKERDALKKYEAIWKGSDPARHASLREAREVLAILRKEGFDVSGGIWGNETRSGAVLAQFIPEEQLVLDAFPEDYPALLIIRGPSGHGHSVEQLKRWVYSGLWGWGLKWCLWVVW